MIEIKDKKTGEISEMREDNFYVGSVLGTKGRFNELVHLANGAIYQNVDFCWRLKGLSKYEWEW